MRVYVRLDNSDGSSPVTKVHRIEDSSVDFAVLLQTIATKLGARAQVESVAQDWELHLEGPSGKKALVEDASDIEDGDTLVLRYSHTVAVKSETNDEGHDASVGSTRHDDDSSVETVPHKLPENVEVIEISDGSDSSDDDSSSGSSSSSEEDDEDDEDYEYESNADADDLSCDETEETKKPSSKPMDPPLEVIMKEQDIPSAPGVNSEDFSEGMNSEDFSEVATLTSFGARRKFDTDQAVKSKIIKLLNTGFHDGSNEHEAKKAMKHAQRLMQKHNLSQAALLKEREKESSIDGGVNGGEEVLKGGLVTVCIVYRKTQKPSQLARWIENLMTPVEENFSVKSYKTVRRGRKCSVTFYGIYMNCQLAAYAFRVAVERISQMAAEHKPDPPGFLESSVSIKSSRLSYALGIVRGIKNEVDRNIEQEKKRRERKLERARRAVASGEAYEESDDEKDEDDDGSNNGDGLGFSFPSTCTPPGNEGVATMSFTIGKGRDNEENNVNEPHESAGSEDSKLSGDNLTQRLEEMEQEEQTALVLVNHQEKVAEDVLKHNGIKIYSGRKRKRIAWDHTSYEKGILDSKEIDLNQRAIKDDWTKKVKKEEK